MRQKKLELATAFDIHKKILYDVTVGLTVLPSEKEKLILTGASLLTP